MDLLQKKKGVASCLAEGMGEINVAKELFPVSSCFQAGSSVWQSICNMVREIQLICEADKDIVALSSLLCM